MPANLWLGCEYKKSIGLFQAPVIAHRCLEKS